MIYDVIQLIRSIVHRGVVAIILGAFKPVLLLSPKISQFLKRKTRTMALENNQRIFSLQEQQEESSSLSWSEILQKARDTKQLLFDDGSTQETMYCSQFQEDLLCNFPQLHQQLSCYADTIQQLQKSSNNDLEEHTIKIPKKLILGTRNALRFGLFCLSFAIEVGTREDRPNDGDHSFRHMVQSKAVMKNHVHLVLAKILSLSGGGDKKCRTMSAKLLSNLITGNCECGTHMIESVGLSPSDDVVTSRIMETMDLTKNNTPAKEEKEETFVICEVTWVDMLLGCVRDGNREALEATVAALYNCLLSLRTFDPSEKDQLHSISEEEDTADCNDTEKNHARSFALQISRDKILMSTLLRQMISVNSIKMHIKTEQQRSSKTSDDESPADGTTEWIVLLIDKLCRFGTLSHMYNSVGSSMQKSNFCLATPEQVVLLHCVGSFIEDATHPSNASPGKDDHPLGDHVGTNTVVSSHIFLAQQAKILHKALSTADNEKYISSTGQANDQEESSELICGKSAYASILEILASSLGSGDQEAVTKSRLALGNDVSLLVDVVQDLGKIVDILSAKNHGLKARELKIGNDEQRRITVLVRLCGNLCYQCRQNQDLMRTILIPFADEKKKEMDTSVLQNASSTERTALHVLLSCTSFSYGCFTLREWAIVALRNVLENNEENQQLVEKLEAQQPVSTPELQKMGVKVDVTKKGEVRVLPANITKNS